MQVEVSDAIINALDDAGSTVLHWIFVVDGSEIDAGAVRDIIDDLQQASLALLRVTRQLQIETDKATRKSFA